MFGWFSAERRAAKRYARELPPWLRKGFGSSEFYTAGQIRAGIKALNLDPEHNSFGFAAFLPEAEYLKLMADRPLALSYAEAREKFLRWVPPRGGGWEPLTETNSNIGGPDL